MRILSLTACVTILGLFSSCDKKPDTGQNDAKIDGRIFDHAHLLTSMQKDSIFQIIKTLDDEVGSSEGCNFKK